MNKIEQLIEELCPQGVPACRQGVPACPQGVPACRQAGSLRRISSADLMPESKEGIWYVYVLECENRALYKGFTTDIHQRFIQHLTGKGAKYTREHKPTCLFYYEICSSEEEAVKREKYLKSGSAREILKQLQGLI